MSENHCTQVDAYLLGDLDERQTEAFEFHVLECDRCRAELVAHERVHTALEAQREIAAPNTLRRSLAAAARRHAHRRMIRRGVAAAAVAAAAGLFVALSAAPDRAPDEPAPHVAAQEQVPAPQRARHDPATTNPKATVDLDGMIAVPVESPSPDVTVVTLHPTLSTQRRMQFVAAMTSDIDANGGN